MYIPTPLAPHRTPTPLTPHGGLNTLLTTNQCFIYFTSSKHSTKHLIDNNIDTITLDSATLYI